MRRIPIYILLDTPESMRGEACDNAFNGLNQLLNWMLRDPILLERGSISLISFDTFARKRYGLSELLSMSLELPSIRCSGLSKLSEAILLFLGCIDYDILHSHKTARENGWEKPLVLLLSDGHFSGEWSSYAEHLRRQDICIFCFSCSQKADYSSLNRISDGVINVSSLLDQIESIWISYLKFDVYADYD